MKLQKALKLRKKLTGEIAQLKQSIQNKNSFIQGSVDIQKYSVSKIYTELLSKIQELVSLKYAINEANRDIQSKIYLLAEYKGLITFWTNINTNEGQQQPQYGQSMAIYYECQYDELICKNIIKEFQDQVDALQDEIDFFNNTTEIPYDEYDSELDTRVPSLDSIKNINTDADSKYTAGVNTAGVNNAHTLTGCGTAKDTRYNNDSGEEQS